MIDLIDKTFRLTNQEAWSNNAPFWIENYIVNDTIKTHIIDIIDSVEATSDHSLRLLDLGCGSGWLVNFIPNTLGYVGIDNCQSFIQFSKSKYGDKGEFYQIDFEEELKENDIKALKSDIIVASLSLIEMSHLKIVFKNLMKVVNEKGIIIIIGLEPINEIFRYAESNVELKYYLNKYSKNLSNTFIGKKIEIKSNSSKMDYYRILYTIYDYIFEATEVGFQVDSIDFNITNATPRDARPIYQSLVLLNK